MTAPRAKRRTAPFRTLEQLGAEMLQFHGGMGDPIYAAGSYYFSGKRHPSRAVEEAADRELTKLYDHPDPYWTKKDMAGLWRAIITLTRLLEFDPKSKRDLTLRRKTNPRRKMTFFFEDLETGHRKSTETMKDAKISAKLASMRSGHVVAVVAVDGNNVWHPQGAYYGRSWRGGGHHYAPRGRQQ